MKRLTWICVVSLSALVGGCGNDAGFSGEAGKRSSGDLQATPTPTPGTPGGDPFSSLTWFWQCDSSPITLPDDGDDNPVLEGAGPHKFDPNQVSGTPVTFSGHLCQPQEIPRDIVFVVDVSGSMATNDRGINGACGRRSAIESVMNTVTNGNARFGIVTFASGLSRSSSMLADNQASLYADVAPLVGDVGNTICAAAGGTNYDAGLSRAAELLRSGRPNATKEIYFISDAEPDAGRDGIALANSLKTVGIDVGGTIRPVTIATVMLAGTDTILEKSIASKDAAGVPLHAYVTQTAQLEKVLADLSNNKIVGGELRYRFIGDKEFTVVNLLDHLQGFDFVLPSITIDVQAYSTGLEVEYEYWDKHDNRYVTGGKLLWTAVSSGGS